MVHRVTSHQVQLFAFFVTIKDNFNTLGPSHSFSTGRLNPNPSTDVLSHHIKRKFLVSLILSYFAKGASTRSYTRLFYLVLLYVYDPLSIAHVQKYVCVYDVLQPCWIFLYVVQVYDVQMFELALFRWAYYQFIITDVSNQMVFLQDIHYKLFYVLIFSIKRVKKAKLLWSVEDCR